MSSEVPTSPLPCPPSWRLIHLKNICTKIGSGATPKGGQAAYQEQRSNYALVRSQNVLDRDFSDSGLAFISDEQAEGLKSVRLERNDILLNITGDGITFGRACLVPKRVLPACVNQHVSIIRLDPKQAHPGYVLSYLTHPLIKSYIESFNAGGSRRAITKGHIESFVVPLPPVSAQKLIAETLGAFDDRIALLRETNATLEAIAQALFKSWFVDFDPVHAKAKGEEPEGLPEDLAALFPDSFEESPLGLVPKGWRVSNIEDLMELAYGKALKSTDRIDGPVPVYGSGGVTGYHNASLVNGPSIIIGRKGTVGSLYWEDRPFFPIDTVFYVRTERPLTYCYYLLKTLGLENMNTDGAVPGLNRNNAYRLRVVIPPEDVQAAFDNIVSTLRNRIFSNTKQSQTLSTLRDTLLPRLISGQLRLPEAEALATEMN